MRKERVKLFNIKWDIPIKELWVSEIEGNRDCLSCVCRLNNRADALQTEIKEEGGFDRRVDRIKVE